jgi:hypothetical protein
MNQHVPRPDNSERTEYGLTLTDAQPLTGIPALWRFAALLSTLLMGVLALIAALHFGRSILLPVVAALIVGITLAPAVKLGSRFSIPQPVSALGVVVLVAVLVGLVLTFFAAPLSEWIARAPEIGKVVQEKLRVLDYPLSVVREIRNAVMPAASHGPTVAVESNPAEMVGTRWSRSRRRSASSCCSSARWSSSSTPISTLRQKLIIFVRHARARLRMMRIWNDIERNLVELCRAGLADQSGARRSHHRDALPGRLPNPVTFGLLITVLNYVPYIGPAIFALVLFCVGLIAMPSLLQAALAPALFVLIATVEGHFITPSIVGRRLTISPFLVFLALAFWPGCGGRSGRFSPCRC